MQTFSSLKSKLRLELFPQGEAQNLVVPHNKAFVEALIDLQKFIGCLQFNNIEVYRPCSILFQCGQSVITAPKGSIFRVSTFDKINSATCKEDAEKPTNFCAEVVYTNVEYCRQKKLVEQILCQHCGPFQPISSVIPCGYPTPTNHGYSGFPELPLGFQYPQASLDRTGNCILGCQTPRARSGIWSFNNGRIYLAPWVQSTETIVLLWNGIRRTWLDSDLVNSSADYEAAIKEYVWWQHYKDYERDLVQAQVHQQAYYDARAMLIRDCREETRDHSCEPSLAKQANETLQGQAVGTITTTTSTATPTP